MLYANNTLNDNYHYGKLSIEKGQYLQRTVIQVVNYLHLDSIVYQLYRVLKDKNIDLCRVYSKDVLVPCLRFINAQSSLYTGVANISTPAS